MDLIVVDPPWYSRETRAFLLTAIRNASPGSKVLLSVPPVGTRPGVEHEWQELLIWAGGVGLRLLAYETEILPYISPLFEKNALRAAGVELIPSNGDAGTLRHLSGTGHLTSQKPWSLLLPMKNGARCSLAGSGFASETSDTQNGRSHF